MFSARAKLPFVSLNAAATVDGKLAPATRHFVPFSSRRDQTLLFDLRASADAVLSGARTVDGGLVDLGPGPARYRRLRLERGLAEYNLRLVASGSASLNPAAEIFRHRFSPVIVLVSRRAPAARVRRLRTVADEVAVFGDDQIDFRQAFAWLRQKWNVRRLLCEGGGEVNGALFEQGLVDQVYLTIVPLVFGGRNAPTLADGAGVTGIGEATRLHLTSCERVGGELFLVYKVRRSARPLVVAPEEHSETYGASGRTA